MKLKSVKVNGFRNLKEVKLDISEVVGILSVNNYGKSNLLSSIVFGLMFMQQHPRIKQEMMRDAKVVPMLNENLKDNFCYTIECEKKSGDEIINIVYSFEFKWGNPIIPGEIVSESLKIKNLDSPEFSTYLKRLGNKAFYKSSKSGRCDNEIQIDSIDMAVNKITAYDNLYYVDLLKELLNINVYVDRHFETSSVYGITLMSEQELQDLTLKPEINIPKTLYTIKQEHPEKFELIKNIFTSLFPSIEGIDIEELSSARHARMARGIDASKFSDKYYILYVNDKNLKYEINFLGMSDGARRILLLLTFIVLADLNNYDLICIEEPENSINPGLLRNFLISITELAENTKVIFASHSPYLINYMNPENLYLGIPNDEGFAIFKRISNKTNNLKRLEKNVCNSYLQLGDYLFDLMSGAEDDIKEMVSYVEE